MKEIIHNSWQEVLSSEFSKDYYLHLREFLKKEYASQKIHPDMYHIYEALELTPYEEVKVVIRTRSLSWRKSSSWLIFFCATRRKDPAIVKKYL